MPEAGNPSSAAFPNASTMKILTVIGARPQLVKAAVVSHEIQARQQAGTAVQELIVHTGQHFDKNMSDVFFDEMSIPRPHRMLALGGLSHGAMTGRMIEQIESVLVEERPDWMLVYGDTNSTMAGALAAVKLHIPVAHVEAGLRSWNRAMPEEINRVVTDHVSSLLFAPTDSAVANLKAEGIAGQQVVRTGDVMFDASLFYASKAVNLPLPAGVGNRPFALVTIHRAENTDDPKRLQAIVEALERASRAIHMVFPVHPRTRGALGRLGLLDRLEAIATLLDPVGYLEMVQLEKACTLVVTDSGGVQKEAYFFGKPCVTLRTETEWTELVEIGANVLVAPDDAQSIAQAIADGVQRTVDTSAQLYGDGHAAAHIVDQLLSNLHGSACTNP
ncbi:non-hydrolyzing UDP-N-acetylglucosamine 2-epimerase [Acidovorax sp. NCPPB 3576]|uniref:non-hydrolyzing UDP-N-acetylglucosamine 2-epimerase n=1 Tax=Acidovorax sp. NCPPB 3576 TaxID=2940488 RepID=UPI00234A4F30|nr:UDP-N-acetylglucosamine 2-epimerase (non-hydrolyzing) [Acidovorax sp. NCPPB 3576]